MSGVYGASLFYANRESKQDLDIEKITIENCIDGEQYRWALTPFDNNQRSTQGKQNQNYYGGKTTKTMLQLRYRDKFVVVSEAPWLVFDHMVFPSLDFARALIRTRASPLIGTSGHIPMNG